MLAWLHRSKPSLVSLNADCQSPVVEAVLAALACSSMPLRKIWIVYASISVLDLVSTFDNLVECALHSYNEALQVLPHLADLSLTSSFIGLKQLAHLTSLSLERACPGIDCSVRSAADCPFVSCLEMLSLDTAKLYGLHQQGPSACSSLKSLSLGEPGVFANDGEVQIADDLTRVPETLRSLTLLTALYLLADSAVEPSLQWIFELSALQELRVAVFRFQDGSSLHQLSALTRLTELYLQGWLYLRHDVHEVSPVSFDFGWHSLQLLQRLHVSDMCIFFGSETLQLLKLENLRCVTFRNIATDESDSDCNSIAHFAALAYKFAKQRPEVKLIIDELDDL